MSNTELMEFITSYKDNVNKGYNDALERAIIHTHIEKENTNRVVVYTGSFIKEEKYGKIAKTLTYDNDPNITYKQYTDIETGEIHQIPLELLQVFLQRNIIIQREVQSYSYDEYDRVYNEARRQFFEDILDKSQAYAVLRLTSR